MNLFTLMLRNVFTFIVKEFFFFLLFLSFLLVETGSQRRILKHFLF